MGSHVRNRGWTACWCVPSFQHHSAVHASSRQLHPAAAAYTHHCNMFAITLFVAPFGKHCKPNKLFSLFKIFLPKHLASWESLRSQPCMPLRAGMFCSTLQSSRLASGCAAT